MADYQGQSFINIDNRIFNVAHIVSISAGGSHEAAGRESIGVFVRLTQGEDVRVFLGDSHSSAAFVEDLWKRITAGEDEIGLVKAP